MDRTPENRAFLRRITRGTEDQSFVQALRVSYLFLADKAATEEAFAAEVAAAQPDAIRRRAIVQRFRRIIQGHPDPSFVQALREAYPSLAEEAAAEEAAAEEAAVAQVNAGLLELHAAAIAAAARPDEATSSRGPAARPDKATSSRGPAAVVNRDGLRRITRGRRPLRVVDPVRVVEPAAIAAAVYPDATKSAAAVLPDTAPSSHVDAAVRAVEPASGASASDAASVTEHESDRRPYRGNTGHFRYKERVAFAAFQQARTRNTKVRAAWNYVHTRLDHHNENYPHAALESWWFFGFYAQVTEYLRSRYSAGDWIFFGCPDEQDFLDGDPIDPDNKGPQIGHPLQDDNPRAC